MRMQIAFRETEETRSGYRIAIAGGVIETSPEDRLSYDECRVTFQFSFREDGVPFSAFCHRNPQRLSSETDVLFDTSTLEGLLTCRMDRAQPSDFLNAELFLRETSLAPSAQGASSYVFSGLVYLNRNETLSYLPCRYPTSGSERSSARSATSVCGQARRTSGQIGLSRLHKPAHPAVRSRQETLNLDFTTAPIGAIADWSWTGTTTPR